ncbi:MAG: cation-translocating P-type ATPase [Anaerolineales bacterium]|nr:cation-translocating P-type ATPase [Anaerolineales bacterium]
MNWHSADIQEIISKLNVNSQSGLSESEAAARFANSGANEIIERGGRSPLRILWEQISATLVLILVSAAAIAAWLGETKNAIAIFAIAALHIFMGYVQEYRAEKSVAALKNISTPKARALRGGAVTEISARNLVAGDIIQLETGAVIPADLRLLETVNLKIQEAALTGESEATSKQSAALSQALPLSDRRNMAYMGTFVTQGRGLGLVVATGMNTELGKLVGLIQETPQKKAPLQNKLDALGENLALIGAGITALVFIIGFFRGDEIRHILLTFVNIALAIVPESFPIVITIALTFGAQRMLTREALIRKLPAVETLGAVTVICSDKTGTLTENRMTVVVLDIAEHALDLTEEIGRSGSLRATRGLGAPAQSSLSLAAIGGALCNDAKLIDTGDDRYHTLGDPTEGALVAAAAKMGYWKSSLDSSFPRAAELSFNSERKRMTTIHDLEQYSPEMLAGLEIGSHRYIAFTKGSVGGLLDVASHIWAEGKSHPLDAEWRAKMEAANERLAKKGMRVLGVAFRLLDSIPDALESNLEKNLTLVGLFGMIDPPRPEVRDAIAACRAAGIRPVMITSDDALTAMEIARQLGITDSSRHSKVISGAEIEKLSSNELKNIVNEVNVFAQIEPEHKLKIVRALQKKGHVVAITGDGVNDAPALRKADVGIAMGISGADISKETSDLILLDDSFTTIIAAIKEGRAVSENIRKFINFSVAGNIGKALVMLLAPFSGTSLPLIPLQALWLNLYIDGLLGLGMSAENPEANASPRKPDSRSIDSQTIWRGALIGALALSVGAWYYFAGRAEWQTMIFASIAFMQIFHALASRSNKAPSVSLLGMLALAVALQITTLYVPSLAKLFEVMPLNGYDLMTAMSMGLVVFAAMELGKKLSVSSNQ